MRPLWLSLRRLAGLVRVLARHGLAHLGGTRWSRFPRLARRLPPGDLSGPQRLSAILEDLGGSFIKFGQMLALQPDILSLEYCNALFDLLDQVEPFDYAEVDRIVRAELGRGPEEVFESFERAPIATASIGQVHVAWLDGKKVAVKVQRPVVERDFTGDIRVMTACVRAIRRFRLRSLEWLIEPMSEFVAWTQEELDYRNEARSMRQMRQNSLGSPSEYVPEVCLVTRRVLVAEFMDGVTVLDYLRAVERGDQLRLARLGEMGFDASLCARRVIDNFLGDAFRHGLFHADLHPANLMILAGNQIGYLDFGITGVLSKHSRLYLVQMTLAYTRGDIAGMCAAFLKVSAMDERSDAEAFRRGLERFAEVWYERSRGGQKLKKNFTLVMLDMLRLSRATGIWPERDVIKYIRSAIAIDGLITRFAPSFEVGAYLAEVCDRSIRGEARRALVSRSRMVSWAAGSAQLLSEGAERWSAVLARLSAGRATKSPEAPASELEGQAMRLGLVAVVLALVIATHQAPPPFGWNIYTASFGLLGTALAFLTRAVWRLSG